MMPPMSTGLMPMLAAWMAFTMSLFVPLSKGWMAIVRASGVEMAATFLRGCIEP